MKLLVLLFALFASSSLWGQDTLQVKIEQRPTSTGIQSAFEIMIPQATQDEAIAFWKETVAPRKLFKSSPKMEKIQDEWWIRNIVINDITSVPLNSITQISSFPGHIYIRIFLQRDDSFIGSPDSPEQTTKAASDFIRNYGVDLYRLAVEKELTEEKKELRKLENELNKLSRRNKNFDGKIDDSRQDQKDFDNTADIHRTDLRQAKRTDEISSEEREEIEKELKSAEKKLKKAQRAENRIERKMNKNEKEQRDIIRSIEKQEETVERVKEKLKNIR